MLFQVVQVVLRDLSKAACRADKTALCVVGKCVGWKDLAKETNSGQNRRRDKDRLARVGIGVCDEPACAAGVLREVAVRDLV
jgi:hypothetical protein